MKLLQHLGLAIFVALVLVPTSAYAQQQKFNFGVRTGLWAENADPFIGVEALTPLTDRIFFNPNVQYVSRDEGADRLVVNADVHYDFPTRPDRFLWAGAGAAGLFGGGTNLGLNVFAGYGWDYRQWIPYVQGKFILSSDNEFEAAVGIRF